MLHPSTLIEQQLNRAAAQWRWKCWSRYAATIGAGAAASILLLGVVIVRGWITSSAVAGVLTVLIGISGMASLGFMTLVVLIRPLRRAWLAESVERAQAELADRLNAVVHVEDSLAAGRARGVAIDGVPLNRPAEADLRVLRQYGERIRAQAGAVISRHPAPRVFPMRDLLIRAAVLLAVTLVTVWFYQRYHPWSRLTTPDAGEVAKKDAPTLTIPPPEEAVVEEVAPWGEVRISEPGGDLRMTKLDSVVLQIEAAASSPLESVTWYSSRNGGPEEEHPLPEPTDPRYATYRPEINAVERKLNDWDVVAYYAKAKARDGRTFQSETYFLEVAPLREDVDAITNVVEDDPVALLNELTQMIDEQRDVVRQQQQLATAPAATAEASAEKRTQLARREDQLAAETRHVAAEAKAQLDSEQSDSTVPQGLHQRLADAEKSLADAAAALRDGQMPESRQHTTDALSKLTDARQYLHEQLRQQADALADGQPKPQGEAPNTAEQAHQMRQRRERQQSTQRALEELAQRERNLLRQSLSREPSKPGQLATEQEQVNVALEDLLRKEPEFAEKFSQQCDATRGACRNAAQALQSMSPNASQAVGEAAQQLSKLASSPSAAAPTEHLTDAHRLKQLLDQQADLMRDVAAQPEQFSEERLQTEAETTQDVAQQLKQLAEQSPTSEQFGQPLRDALSDENQQQLNRQCQGLTQGMGAGQRGQAAQQLGETLDKISKAFDASVPHSGKGDRGEDRLRDHGENALTRGLRELESLARDEQRGATPDRDGAGESKQSGKAPAGNGNPTGNDGSQPPSTAGKPNQLTAGQRHRLREDARQHLSEGVYGTYGHNERSQAVVGDLDRQLQEEKTPIDASVIESMQRAIQSIRHETSVSSDEKQRPPSEMSFVDPSRLPPTYRRPIQSYFQKLSEQR